MPGGTENMLDFASQLGVTSLVALCELWHYSRLCNLFDVSLCCQMLSLPSMHHDMTTLLLSMENHVVQFKKRNYTILPCLQQFSMFTFKWSCILGPV